MYSCNEEIEFAESTDFPEEQLPEDAFEREDVVRGYWIAGTLREQQ